MTRTDETIGEDGSSSGNGTDYDSDCKECRDFGYRRENTTWAI